MALLGLLLRFRDQSADVPVPHLAARRAHRSPHGRQRHPRRRPAEDGHLRFPALLSPDVSRRDEPVSRLHDRSLADWHHLRRARLHDAEGHEKTHRLFLGEPYGLLHAGNFRAHAARPHRQHHPADQPRHFHRRAVPDRRRSLRTPPHALNLRIWRPRDAHAKFRRRLPDRHTQFSRHAAPQRLHRRVHNSARRF